MYQPKHFEITDPAVLHALVAEKPLATWVLQHEGELQINHVPFLLDPTRGEHGCLLGHVARANPVWRAVAAGVPTVAVFQGAQAYVSPNWYPSKHEHGKAVPTWNYAVVHAHGVGRTVEDKTELLALMHRLTDAFESTQALPWNVSDAPADYIDAMLNAIVGIEIPIQRWEGKWKVSQNRPEAERMGAAAGLMGVGTAEAVAMARLVQPK